MPLLIGNLVEIVAVLVEVVGVGVIDVDLRPLLGDLPRKQRDVGPLGLIRDLLVLEPEAELR